VTTLLIAEHDNTTLDPQTAQALTAALALGEPVDVLVAGSGCASVAAAAATLGVARVLIADDPRYKDRAAEPMATLIVSLAPDHAAIVAAATSTGKDVLPRVAALFDVMQVSDIIAVEAPDTFRRLIYAGNAVETVCTADPVKLITVRASAFAATPSAGTAAEILPVVAADDPGLAKVLEERSAKSDRPELTAAKIVISGGRAFGSKELFDALLLPLAQKLNAAVGASRAAVDAGYAANELQVGQTGKIVAPDLYIACGISGAIQHLAGMKDAKVIVAINADRDAPIFAIADYGLVGDIFALLPELTRAL
jgi:electron transfer flavoprotein alpha subunit